MLAARSPAGASNAGPQAQEADRGCAAQAASLGSADGVSPLFGLSVRLLGLEADQDEALRSTLPALGARHMVTSEGTTHCIVPPHPAGGWEPLREDIAACVREKIQVVAVPWLHAVLAGERSWLDDDFLYQHVPPYVQTLHCKQADRSLVTSKKLDSDASAGGSLLKRRRSGKGPVGDLAAHALQDLYYYTI